MFWSAALELKSQQRTPRSYGSFSRSSSSSSFHIPQSIPEHQPVSDFSSPLPERREEYMEKPDTAFARTKAALQLSEHTQTALKLLLQGEKKAKGTPAKKKPQYTQDMYSMSLISGYSAGQAPMKKLEKTPLLARAHGQEEPNPQENGNEHNYWMQELERRRAGLRRSRRRTCTPLSERATTSPLKVGVVMCSVPLVLVLGFVLFVMLFGDGSVDTTDLVEVVNNLLGFGGDDSVEARHDAAAEHRSRIARTFARPPEDVEESAVLALDLNQVAATKLRGTQSGKTD